MAIIRTSVNTTTMAVAIAVAIIISEGFLGGGDHVYRSSGIQYIIMGRVRA